MLLIISVIPVVLVLMYVRRMDRFHSEPMKLLARLFIIGALSVIPIIIVELILMNFNVFSGDGRAFYDAFVVAGLTEEAFKWAIVMIFAFHSVEYDEPLDGIVYAVFVSMGFAIVENIMYVTQNGVGVGIMRAVTSVPAHMLFGVMSGYYLSMYKFVRKPYYLTLSLLIPIILHGFYNFILLANQMYLILFIPYMIFMWFIAKKRIVKYQIISMNIEEELIEED